MRSVDRSRHIVKMDGQKNSMLKEPSNHIISFLENISVQQGLLLKGTRLGIPTSVHLNILDKLDEGHLGITKCRERAKRSVWWPGLSKQLEDLIQNCNVCIKERSNKAEPLIQSVLPDRPWQKIGTDLFELKGKP